MTEVKIAFDTGFFIKLPQNNKTAVTVWKKIKNDNASGFICCLSILEIKKLILKGAIDKYSANVVLNDIYDSCSIIWIDKEDILVSAARISHGNGIPSVDSVILASFLKENIKIVYTTDPHMTRYKKRYRDK